jgi:hypothetical protein
MLEHGAGTMSDALSDLTQDVTAEYVRRRVEDWERRVIVLYDLLEDWLPPECTASRTRAVLMNEELMQRFGIAARNLPILDIAKGTRRFASIIPHGLWIIGANGRLDLRSEKGMFIIIDRSHAFDIPSWHMASLADRQYERLTQAMFHSAL